MVKYYNALGFLGQSLQIIDHLFEMIESMIYQNYEFLNKYNVSDVRYEKRCGEKFPKPSKIPPTKDELHQHVKRVSYQVFLWKNALEANQEIPEADQHGWSVIDRTYKVHWIDNQTAPEEILEMVVCGWKSRKCAVKCQCVLLQVPCADICKCKGNIIIKSQNCFLYLMKTSILKHHCVKSVRIRSYSGPYFPAFGLNTRGTISNSKYYLSNLNVIS